MRSHLTSITLMGTALLLKEPDGKYIHASFLRDDFVHEVAQTSKRSRLGLKTRSDERMELGDETLRLFVEFDTGLKGGKRFNRIMEQYSRMYRLIVMGQNGTINTETVVTHLREEIARYGEWASYREVQERSWM